MNENLKESLARLHHKPGVYQYYDKSNTLLYVGKAKDLFKRVHSYWQKKSSSPWTNLLVAEIDRVHVIEVNTELEALMLENSLIKSLKPKYNIQLRDDKTFPFLRVSHEKFPTFMIVRKVKNDKARYFGPYFSATYLRAMLKLLQGLYGIKTTSEKSYESRSSVPQEIGLGARNLDNEEVYKENVQAAIRFLSTPQPQMEKIIKSSMHEAAKNNEFERAAILRDRLQALEQLRSSQSLFSAGGANRDYIGIDQAGKLISVYILHERDGKITNHQNFLFEFPAKLHDDELISLIIDYLYINGLTLPNELIVSSAPGDKDLIEQLHQQSGKKIKFHVPQRGELKTRLETATENASYQLKLEALKKNRREHGLAHLAQILELKKIPKRIEAFDISNLGSTNIVGASIVFIDGQPAKKEYRKYKINTPEGQDDFASMRELVFRRVSNPDRPLPDLLLIDGGKGQLSAAMDALKVAKTDLPIMALAKKEELLFLPNKIEPIALDHSSDALLLLTAIRDEVHRFVISFHRFRRAKKLLS